MGVDSGKASLEKDKEIASVLESVNIVKKAGFGEVRIVIRNGAVYRILKTEDKVLDKE